MGSRVVNATPNKLAQLPGLQKSLDWRSAAFRAVRIATVALKGTGATRFNVDVCVTPPALAVITAI
jgi:hypothetical protein